MKYLFKMFFLSYLLIGCESTNEITNKKKDNNMEKKSMNIIHYETKEFMNKKPKIDLDKAWELHQKYHKRPLNKMVYSMYFIIDNYYVFSEYAKSKLMEASVEGLWIHSETGEVKYIKSDEIIMPQGLGWSYNIFK